MRIKRREKISVLEIRDGESSTDSYSMFLFAMRSPKAREKCTNASQYYIQIKRKHIREHFHGFSIIPAYMNTCVEMENTW